MELSKRLEQLKQQAEQAKAMYLQAQGAIAILQEQLNEEEVKDGTDIQQPEDKGGE